MKDKVLNENGIVKKVTDQLDQVNVTYTTYDEVNPKSLKELGIENPDLELLAENSLKDACAPGNPYMPTKEVTIKRFKEISN